MAQCGPAAPNPPHTAESVLEVGLPLGAAFACLANLDAAHAWLPFAIGSTKWTSHVSPIVPDNRPLRVGSTFRVLFGEPLNELLRCRVTALQPPFLLQFSGVGPSRTLRLTITLAPAPGDPARTRLELRWWWRWRGWRAVPGLAKAARAAAEEAPIRVISRLKRFLEASRPLPSKEE